MKFLNVADIRLTDWFQITKWQIPSEYFLSSYVNENHKSLPLQREHSYCQTIIIFVSLTTNLDLNQLTDFGHPIKNNFVVISSNNAESLCKDFTANRHTLLHGLSSIYRMALAGNGCSEVLYVVAPDSYIGDFEIVSQLNIPRGLMLLNGRTFNVAFPNIKPIFFVGNKTDEKNIFWVIQQPDASMLSLGQLYFALLRYSQNTRNTSKNGTWTGLVGELMHGKADIVPCTYFDNFTGTISQHFIFITHCTRTFCICS